MWMVTYCPTFSIVVVVVGLYFCSATVDLLNILYENVDLVGRLGVFCPFL